MTHRESQLAKKATVRQKLSQKKSERIQTLVGLLEPEVDRVDLAGLHQLIQEGYLPIDRSLLDQERKARRAGRPPSAREVALSETVRSEEIEYEAGMDVPDLRDPVNVRLLRGWNGDTNMLPLFDFVRVSGKNPTMARVVQQGNHKELVLARQRKQAESHPGDVEMNGHAPGPSSSTAASA